MFGLLTGLVATVAYLADTVGEATMRVRGVILETNEGTLPQDTRVGRQLVTNRQVLISTPHKTFWWDGDSFIGPTPAVYLLQGRLSHWWYVQAVEPRSAFDDDLEQYNEATKQLRDDYQR